MKFLPDFEKGKFWLKGSKWWGFNVCGYAFLLGLSDVIIGFIGWGLGGWRWYMFTCWLIMVGIFILFFVGFIYDFKVRILGGIFRRQDDQNQKFPR